MLIGAAYRFARRSGPLERAVALSAERARQGVRRRLAGSAASRQAIR
jgi:hypothetical protein